jgi:hypothetical protein
MIYFQSGIRTANRRALLVSNCIPKEIASSRSASLAAKEGASGDGWCAGRDFPEFGISTSSGR